MSEISVFLSYISVVTAITYIFNSFFVIVFCHVTSERNANTNRDHITIHVIECVKGKCPNS